MKHEVFYFVTSMHRGENLVSYFVVITYRNNTFFMCLLGGFAEMIDISFVGKYVYVHCLELPYRSHHFDSFLLIVPLLIFHFHFLYKIMAEYM